ncbi:MAG: hypothetical protein Q9179_008012, partial [Wetmoreana sp. 5 TL-2023]
NSGSIFSSKPHMHITSAQTTTASTSTPPLIGTNTFHSFSRVVDMEFHGRPVSLEPDGIFTRAHSFASPAFGERLRWECDGIFGSDLMLVNARKELIARFDASNFAWSKVGKLHIVNGGISGEALDEIVVSGCGMLEHERRRKKNSSSSSGGAVAGVAA